MNNREAFEAWANTHGGLDLTVHEAMDNEKLSFPCTYYSYITEIAWRAFANKKEPAQADLASQEQKPEITTKDINAEFLKECADENGHCVLKNDVTFALGYKCGYQACLASQAQQTECVACKEHEQLGCPTAKTGIYAVPLAQQESKELGQPYGIVDPDYARIYTQSRIIAWQYGYSCLMHGSFTRDLDLLLVPWEESARDNHDQLLKLIADACGLQFKDGEKEIYKAKVDWTNKPHGRKSCSLFFKESRDRRWIDIAVLPVSPPAQEGGDK